MDFLDKIRELSARIQKQMGSVLTEEATKNAFVLPFLKALGYDVFDPTEVTPELNADVGTKKGEKVDYAILRDAKPIILIECKHHSSTLSPEHLSQLFRYFTTTEARFGILTNGLLYQFFTDLEAPNKMDERPFFEFNILEVKETAVDELKKFSKSSFDLDNILNTASELKYTREIKRLLLDQLQEPSDDFVRCFSSKFYAGKMTEKVRDKFAQFTKQAFKQLINDLITDRLKSALVTESVPATSSNEDISSTQATDASSTDSSGAVVTTEEEKEGFQIVRAILREVIPPSRVFLRDVQTHCGVLLDDTNRQPICKMFFNTSKKYLSFFDLEKEEKVPVEGVDDLFKHAERLKKAVEKYDSRKVKKTGGEN